MSDERTLEFLHRQLEMAELESAAWQKSKNGARQAQMSAKLVEALRAEIAEKGRRS